MVPWCTSCDPTNCHLLINIHKWVTCVSLKMIYHLPVSAYQVWPDKSVFQCFRQRMPLLQTYLQCVSRTISRKNNNRNPCWYQNQENDLRQCSMTQALWLLLWGECEWNLLVHWKISLGKKFRVKSKLLVRYSLP